MNKRNSEGYSDPTAYGGLVEVVREEVEINRKNNLIMQVIRTVTDLAGFEIVGRITLRHKESGKVFR